MSDPVPSQVAVLTDDEWRQFQAIPDQGYSHRHWVEARLQERIAQGWGQGYQRGIADERTAEALQVGNGVGGYHGLNRSNPYLLPSVNVKNKACCCRFGAAVSNEYPEFPCFQCPTHGHSNMASENEMCRRHTQAIRALNHEALIRHGARHKMLIDIAENAGCDPEYLVGTVIGALNITRPDIELEGLTSEIFEFSQEPRLPGNSDGWRQAREKAKTLAMTYLGVTTVDAEMAQQITRVRALHTPFTTWAINGKGHPTYEYTACRECESSYPCPTIRTLDDISPTVENDVQPVLVEKITEVQVTFTYGINTRVITETLHDDLKTTVTSMKHQLEIETGGRANVSKIETRFVSTTPYTVTSLS